ncbi:MAG: GUN4 domain-containing protein [Myxacorys californica WJT36-NPBG1]|nr:GUN4 domain-containing protein [Myxacorys californica WJT36-NPBG1]
MFEQTQQIGIKDFNREQKSDFIHKWYRADEREYWDSGRNSIDDREQIEAQIEHRANERATELINQLALNPALNELANNPLLITIIAITYQTSLTLPKHRAKLYQEIFKTLLELRPRRRDTKLTLSIAEENQAVLQVLALNLMQQQKTYFTPQEGAQWIQAKLLEYSAELSPKKFLQEIQDVAGLLAGAESDIVASHLYQFTHKTFQEYLAAVEVYEHHDGECLIEQFHNSDWKEVICFYAALRNATRFVQVALDNRTDYALQLAHRIVIDEGSKVDDETYDRLTKVLETIDLSGALGAKVQLEQRFRDRLASLDDNRIISDVITIGEYHLFMTAQADGQFHSQAKSMPLSVSESRPVTGISWQDARWFCAWLATQASLQSDDVVYDYRLPTEAELQQINDRDSFTVSEDSRNDRTLRIVREELPNHYKSLLSYLANGRWQEADQETDNVMLEVAGRKEKRYLDVKSIQKFPCEDLRIIDQLWVKFSGGHFGFSVQKQIYVECGNPLDSQYYEGKWEAFCDRVAWMKNGNYVDYPNEVIFDTSALRGHLPLRGVISWGRWAVSWSLFSRRDL